MTFPDFQRMEWCQINFAKISLKPMYRMYEYCTTQVGADPGGTIATSETYESNFIQHDF